MNEAPHMRISTDSGEILATPENTSLFQHIGEAALYDHVFITDEEKNEGLYLFRFNRGYQVVSDYMIENGYPLHLNMRDAAECDIRAFNSAVENQPAEVPDTIPDDWA